MLDNSITSSDPSKVPGFAANARATRAEKFPGAWAPTCVLQGVDEPPPPSGPYRGQRDSERLLFTWILRIRSDNRPSEGQVEGDNLIKVVSCCRGSGGFAFVGYLLVRVVAALYFVEIACNEV